MKTAVRCRKASHTNIVIENLNQSVRHLEDVFGGSFMLDLPGENWHACLIEVGGLIVELFEPKHFLFPFLAHALGTLVGAVAAGLLAVGRSIVPAWVIGALFLCAGIANIAMLPGPLWFNTIDVLFAYLPMAWLAQTLVNRLRPPAAA